MELFKLFATLSLNSGSFERALSNSGKGIGGFVKQLGLTQLALSGVEKGFSAITDTISKSVDNYANYEQLVGGVETLFKQSSGKVQQYAQEAYKTAGVSQNDYMTMVTDFSASLINSLGGDTSAAAEVANRAIIDMSDNVNKMGSDMTSVQNAYKGFAKGNFTMLDNLKLGYGGTKTEMERLLADASELTGIKYDIDNFADITKAIGVIQDKLEITGTTAKEAATTISGSKSSMQAAFSDLLTTVATGDQGDFNVKMAAWQESFITYINGNLLPTVTKAIGGSGALAHGIMDAITQIPTSTFSEITSEAEGSLSEVFKGFTELGKWLTDGITETLRNPQVKAGATDVGAALGEFIGSGIANLAENITTWIPNILDLGLKFGGSLIQGMFDGFFGENSELQQIQDFLNGDLVDAQVNATEATGLVMYLQSIYDKQGESVTKTIEWQTAVDQLKEKYPEVGAAIDANGASIQSNINLANQMIEKIKEEAKQQAIMNALQAKINLQAQQEQQKLELEITRDTNQSMLDSASDTLIKNIQAYAKESQRLMESTGMLGYDGMLTDKYNDLVANFANFTGKNQNGETMSVSELTSALTGLIDGINWLVNDQYSEDFEGYQDIGEASQKDDIMTRDEAKNYQESLAVWQHEADTAVENIASLDAEIEATKASIALSQEAMNRSLTSITDGSGQAAEEITEGGSNIGGALSNAAQKIAAIKIPKLGFSYVQGFATGIDDVPYDNFPARLHRGEMVLTQAEANDYRRGGRNNSSVVYADIEGAITSAFEKVGIYLGAERVGDLTTSRTKRNIDQQKNHTLRGMGG